MKRECFVCLSERAATTLFLALSLLLVSTFAFAVPPDRISGAINSSQTFALAKSHHPKAQPQFDRGPVDPSFKLGYITLMMAPSASQQKELDQLLAEQQDRTSPNYHQWLTPQQYADRFGLNQNDLTKIANWLRSEGFQILSVGGGHSTLAFSGAAGQAQHAFGTEIHKYEVDGVEHFANSTPVMLPVALEGIVTGMIGLHDFRPQPANRRQHFGAMGARPEWYDGTHLFPNFLAPGDIYTIYDIAKLATAGIDGTGQKLAVVGQTDVYLADLNDFRTGFSIGPISKSDCTTNSKGVITFCNDPLFSYVLIGSDPGVSANDIGEADLDLEWSGATARKAQIVYVNSVNVYESLGAVISPASGPVLAPVVSMSYGYCESGAPDLESLLQQGNAEGVTILNSAGDDGSAACDYTPQTQTGTPPYAGAAYGLAVSYPASSPEVTGVGGTAISLANDSYPTQSPYWSTTIGAYGGTAVSYIPELAWNDDEELAQFCQSDPSDTFCSQGGSTAVPGWVPLTSTATAAQVQEDIWIYMGGGGASNCWYLDSNTGDCLGAGPGPNGGGFAQPSYQQGLNVPGAPAGVRYVPDVSMLASPDFPGYIWCTPVFEFVQGGSSASSCAGGITKALDNGVYTSVVGGTSASAPVFAGIVALVNQYVVANGFQAAPGLGNINPTLYRLAASNSTNHAFHPVTTGDNMVYCQAGEPSGFPQNVVCPAAGVFGFKASNADAATGYNLVTGLGSVDAYNLALAFFGSEAATTTTVTSSQNPAIQGVSVTFTAVVATAGTNPPTGTVTFYDGTTSLGSNTLGTVNGSQETTLSASTLSVGSHSITAVYGGDSNNAGSTSAVLTQVINAAFTLSANPNTLGIPQGTSGTSTITVNPAKGFSGSVSLAASGLPNGVTASFNPASTTTSSTLTLTASGSATLGTATVTITGTSGNASATTTISLTVQPAVIVTLTPPSVTFGPQPVGTTSGPQVIQLSANGPLSITSITTSAEFAETNNCGNGLPNGGSCQISVTFTPSASGTQNGTLSVYDSGGGSPQTASLSGTGTQPAVTLAPTSLKWGKIAVHTTAAAKKVTLTNSGNATLNISNIAISGDFALTTVKKTKKVTPCVNGSAVAAGASCLIKVTFTPTQTGLRKGNVTFTDNAPNSPQQVPLSGTGK